ncbi:MAG: NAD/NADP octopine/nopaline dehydrogenase family protein [Myxococcales bacterium]|nr:NAD/NADP octopine/nopaline dehydrogenase family protein [Myxococcales bacterium]
MVAALPKIGVVGSGASACALSCYLADRGYDVHVLMRDRDTLSWLDSTRGRLRATGRLEGTYALSWFGSDAAALLARADVVIVATTVLAYPEVIEHLASHLRPRHRLILFSSKLLGAVHVEHLLRRLQAAAVPVVEVDALFASRLLEDRTVWIRGIKAWTLFSAAKRSVTAAFAPLIAELFGSLEPADNVVQRGLTDFGALAHAPTMIANMNAVSRGESFLFYRDGFTEQTVALLEACEAEFHAVARAFGCNLVPMATLLDRYYGCDATSVHRAMRSVPNYRHSQAPTTLEHRFLREDVGCSLVPLSQLASVAGVPTPTIDAVVHLASVLLGDDLRASGRTLERVGWQGLGPVEIMRSING